MKELIRCGRPLERLSALNGGQLRLAFLLLVQMYLALRMLDR